MKLSIFSILKNEEKLVRRMLESVKDADEIIILDTGSEDKTQEICREYTDKVYTDYYWADDFSEAKNLAIKRCKGDWIMGIDGDCYLEKGGIQKIKDLIKKTKNNCINITLVNENNPKTFHQRAKIFKNNNEIFYKGRAHEDLNVKGVDEGDIKMTYGYSENHQKDPDRYIRILTKSVNGEPKNARWKFYLAREYFYKKDWQTAIKIFQEYLKISTYNEEKAEAYYLLSKCYFYNKQGDRARESCLRAIQLNPDFKSALLLMSNLHFEPYKSKWFKIAQQATNKDVIFKTN